MSRETTFIATGDSFMTRRLPEQGYSGFAQLKKLIAEHDVRFNNLEFTAHDCEGSPSAFSGGTWAMAEPEILDDLKAFGFNLYSTANNHSLDYCHNGLLATIKHLKERDMLYAGTGANLALASAPVYFESNGARIAMIALSSAFHDSDIAGNQGPVIPGRPGLNPLRVQKLYCVQQEYFDTLAKLADETDMNAFALHAVGNGFYPMPPKGIQYFGGLFFQLSPVNVTYTVPNKADLARTVKTIQDAKKQADYVLVSVHSHEFAGKHMVNPCDFLKAFAHACIDAGADAILGHGPHELRGIELYKEKPIFYSLGNFIFQSDTVRYQPAEAYEAAGLPFDVQVGEYMDHRSQNDTKGYVVQQNIWRSVAAGFTAENGRIKEINLYPVSLHMELPRSQRGFPTLSRDEETLGYLAELSKPFGTEMQISDGVGHIKITKE